MQPDLDRTDQSHPIVFVSVVLLSIYTVTVLASAIPLKIFQPSWIERVCGSLRGGVSFPLIAMALLLLADQGHDSVEETRLVRRCRRWSKVAALGFVLMIPLQTWAGVVVVHQTNSNEQAQLRPYIQALSSIRAATTNESLLQALVAIPGIPPNLGGTLQEPLPQVREQLLRQIEPQLNARRQQLNLLQGQRWQEGLLRWIKDGLVALFSAIGLAAIGRSSPQRPTLLTQLLHPRPPQNPDYVDYLVGLNDTPEDGPS